MRGERRRKKGLWSEKGRQQLESLSLMPWTTRRRQELLELLDQFDPNIDELSQASYEYKFGPGHEQSLGINGGLLISIP